MNHYSSLAIDDPAGLTFGVCPNPLTTRQGLVLGGGQVYPELNFTLPPMAVERATMPDIIAQYRQIITGVIRRAVDLECPGLVVEFETLPPMTIHPQWAVDITRLLADELENTRAKHGLRSALRVTPTDVREFTQPVRIRSGEFWDSLMRTFDQCAQAGAELLSIESVGGKEVHDQALMMGDISGVIFGLCVMGVRDMRHLWTAISRIAADHGAVSAGDTACGFGNTAMVLAEQKMISRVFASVVRAVTAVRSLVAYECGAVGPGKDCGYENPILKAITGFPMAMEGKSAACAHLSPVGNIAAATADLWSNESVQNIRLLGGMAPTVSLEQLVYDTRLLNRALADGAQAAGMMRTWLVDSDAGLDPQAYILTPDASVALARAIVEAPDAYTAGRAAALTAVRLLRQGIKAGVLALSERERPWLDRIEQDVAALPDSEDAFIEQTMATIDGSKFSPADYDLPG